jgi:heme exporter protein B
VSGLRAILTVVAKDLRSELRTKEALTSTIFFSLLVLLVFNFAFDPGTRDVTVVGAGILWIAFLFAGILAMNRLMLNEREDGGIEGLMLTPVPRTSLYLAKCITLFCLLAIAELLTLALFVVFFNVPIGGAFTQLLLVALLGTVGLVCLGTSFAAMAVRTRTREVMLPLLLIPIAVPLLIAAVETTSAVLSGRGLAEERNWLQLLVVFDALFLALGYLTFPAILEE